MIMIGLVRKHPDGFLTCVPVDTLMSLPHHRQAVVGTRRRGGDRRLALLRGSRKQVVHRNLDRFPFRDFFECLENEFIVKGI